jgi:hypothetical protein
MIQRHINPYSVSRPCRFSCAPCFALVLAFAASACGTSDPATTPPGAAGTGAIGPADTVGRMLDGPETCTAEHTLCARLQVPSDLDAVPDSLHFVIYDSAGIPSHPPNAYAGIFPSPRLMPGEMKYFELSDGGLQGNYWLWCVMYMPGGGLFGLPIVGVDYGQGNPPLALSLDGSPLNLNEPILLSRVSAPPG